jgi:hypothetical protein
MAAADYNGVVQQLYVSYFGRPADTFGLKNFTEQLNAIGAPTTIGALNAQVQADATGTSALSQLINSFSASGEATALYGTDTSQLGVSKFVAAIYQNVFGREADKAGFDFWVAAIESGNVTRASAVADITAGALVNTTPQGLLDKSTVEKKVAVATNFTTALDLPSEFNAYAGEAAAATARGLLQGVTSTTDVAAYQSNIDTAVATIAAVAVPGQSLLLTANIDNLTGGAGNDNFAATITPGATVGSAVTPIGPLDILDGGAGRDTLSIADTSGTQLSLAGLTLRSIENLTVSSNAAFTDVNIASTGVTSAFMASTGAGLSKVTAAGTTDVTLTTANNAGAEVVGGKAVTVNSAGANKVTGTALTGVTVKGGTATIINSTTDNALGGGTTLTAVTLDGVTGANAVTGNGVTSVSLANIATVGATSVAVTNATTNGYALNLNVNKVGTGTGATAVTVTAAEAKTVAINATGASNVILTAAAATAATVTGAAALELSIVGSTLLTSIDGSAATGGLTMTSSIASIKTGAGADKITTGGTASKVTFDLGAGDDVLTMGTGILAGSTINLGAGNDALLGAGSVASTTAAPTVIDGGEGTDTIAAGLINAANASLFRNFEAIDLSTTANLDVQLLTGSTITGLTLNGGAGGATVSNVAATVGLTVVGNNTGTTTIGVATASAVDNVFNIGFNGVAATSAPLTFNVDAGTVNLAGIETVNIASTGAANTWNAITLTDSGLKTLNITGDKSLTLDFDGAVGATGTGNGLALIDGSAATGKLMINLAANTPTYVVASAGLTVRGGSADDMITLGAGKATVVAGAGADMIVTGVGGGTLTGGAGNDTFNVSASVVQAGGTVAVPTAPTAATSVLSTITDFTAGDKINLGTGIAFSATKLTLDSTVTNLELAFTQAAAVAGNGANWFQYGADTYIVADKGTNGFDAGDLVVKLTGLIDLSTATSADGIVTL